MRFPHVRIYQHYFFRPGGHTVMLWHRRGTYEVLRLDTGPPRCALAPCRIDVVSFRSLAVVCRLVPPCIRRVRDIIPCTPPVTHSLCARRLPTWLIAAGALRCNACSLYSCRKKTLGADVPVRGSSPSRLPRRSVLLVLVTPLCSLSSTKSTLAVLRPVYVFGIFCCPVNCVHGLEPAGLAVPMSVI